MNTIEDIKKLAKEYAKRIDLEDKDIVCIWQGDKITDNLPYIKIDSSGMHYMQYERGTVYENQITHNVDELLYWIFSATTFVMACNFETENREELKDRRRLRHSKQLELLEKLNPTWRDLEKQKQEQILVKSPYDDFAIVRADYCGELRKQGYAEIEIKRKAFEKYPLLNGS